MTLHAGDVAMLEVAAVGACLFCLVLGAWLWERYGEKLCQIFKKAAE